MKFLKTAAVMAGILACTASYAQRQIEVEDVIVNKDAVIKETTPVDKWCVWSTDINKQNWSGGAVLRSPVTRRDHKTHNEGAPILHVRIPVAEAGTYSVKMFGATRPLAFSLDGGATWKEITGGVITPSVKINSGFFDCWFDDCISPKPPMSMGPAYIDYFLVTRIDGVKDGLANGGFEQGATGTMPAGWTWFERKQKGGAKLVKGGHDSKQAVHVTAPGGIDWTLENGAVMPVKPGEDYKLTAWVNCRKSGGARLGALGYKNGIAERYQLGSSRILPENEGKWTKVRMFLTIPEEVDSICVRVTGKGEADFLLDDVSMEISKEGQIQRKPLVKGFAKERVMEKFHRSPFAQVVDDGVYISWRLLKTDPAGAAFHVYRKSGGKETRINKEPIVHTTDFLDESPVAGATYVVKCANFKAPDAEVAVEQKPEKDIQPYRTYKISNPDARIQKVAVADLNGDGEYDFVVKHPHQNVDPWNVVWYKSPDTYKLDAILSDGTLLWTYDMGWDIERGIWYSPYIAYDLNGDGKAEVVTRTSAGDHREEDGHVYSGPEEFVVLDGMTGKEIDRGPWIPRNYFGDEGKDSYGFAARNQMTVAYLDGKTPCLINLRGTYNQMVAEAWQLKNNKLERVWTYDNAELSRKWQGQGAHINYALDLDEDGRDEVVLGSAIIDDNGDPLWSTGKGHPDGVFFGKIMPDKPGLQVAYVMETRQKTGGLCVADAKTGKLFWELQVPTHHVDGKGTIGDIDVRYPGCEVAGGDMQILEPGTNKRGLKIGWCFTADGKMLYESTAPLLKFGVWNLYWDADHQREMLRGQIKDHEGGYVSQQRFSGHVLLADIAGDWREEIISSPVKGEFRVYSTNIPAFDRRPCLMQEHNYRMRILSNSMGYCTEAILPYDLESESPNFNLTFMEKPESSRIRVAAVASRKAPVKGKVRMVKMPGVKYGINEFDVDLKPGERIIREIPIEAEEGFANMVKAEFDLGNGTVLKNRVAARAPKQPMKEGFFAQAEDYFDEQGGQVRKRSDKVGVQGHAITHWDAIGHKLSWRIKVPADGEYKMAIRYSNSAGAERRIAVDGKDYGIFTFTGTGGLGEAAADWDHLYPKRNGHILTIRLKAGEHVVTMENTDGKANNLDYLAFVKVK